MVFRKTINLIVFLCLGLFSCFSRNDPPRIVMHETWQCPQRNVRIAIDPLFTEQERSLIIEAIPSISDFGRVAPRIVSSHPDVTIRFWVEHTCAERFLGIYHFNTSYVLIDPDCMASNFQFKTSVIHELGHWLGMRHVCNLDRRTSDGCSPIGFGSATMNPYLSPVRFLSPTALDRIEYREACWNKQHRDSR